MDLRLTLPTPGHLTRILDSTLLRPEASEKEYLDFLREARDGGFRCACLPLYYLPFARLELAGSGVKVGGVIGFPFGYGGSDVKRAEVVFALQQGAQEIDMVMNISALKSRRYEQVKADIGEVIHLARRYDLGKGEGHIIVKVILETCYLTRGEMKQAALLAQEAGADFVKTSTGLGPAGAKVEDVQLLRETVGPGFGVKAAGGIRNLSDVLTMLEAGANRIGTSAATTILQEYLAQYNWR
jgi:deoxyribose-phosphate aldolase